MSAAKLRGEAARRSCAAKLRGEAALTVGHVGLAFG
jgi:hypothetical protein